MSVKHGVKAPSAPLKSRFTNLHGTPCPILGCMFTLSMARWEGAFHILEPITLVRIAFLSKQQPDTECCSLWIAEGVDELVWDAGLPEPGQQLQHLGSG
jgi:hypothetical protein